MARVSYKQGTKATYLGLSEKVSTALYFCTDTRELFKGEDLYSDGMRLIDSYSSLPEFVSAADGILYFCIDTGNGYVLNEERDAWIPVVYGFDNETIGLNESGLMSVKAIPIATVIGLEDRIKIVEDKEQIIKVDTLPAENGNENVIYIYKNACYIWDGSQYVSLSKPLDLTELETKVSYLESQIEQEVVEF